jgi:RNA polymerase sigma factor for flagellar operon FliA
LGEADEGARSGGGRIRGWLVLGQRYLEQEREQQLVRYLPLVKYLAMRILSRLPSHVELDDLINYGIIGLMDAVDKFDRSRGVKFKTYAELRIRGSILDGLRELDWVPRSYRRRQRELERAYRKLESELGRSATDEEVAAELQIGLEDYFTLLDDLKGVQIGSIEAISREGEENLVEYIPDREENTPTYIMEKLELQEVLATGIDKLPEKERLVLSLYYYEGLTMKEVGAVLGITESRVSQLHSKAVLRLRGRLKSKLGES